jgi:molecular chaperone DnaK
MLPAVRTALAQIGSELNPVERDLIMRRAQEVEAAIAGGGATALKKAVAALDEATQQLAALLVEKAMRG